MYFIRAIQILLWEFFFSFARSQLLAHQYISNCVQIWYLLFSSLTIKQFPKFSITSTGIVVLLSLEYSPTTLILLNYMVKRYSCSQLTNNSAHGLTVAVVNTWYILTPDPKLNSELKKKMCVCVWFGLKLMEKVYWH